MARRGEAAPHAGRRLAKTENRERLFVLKYLDLKFNGKQAAISVGIPEGSAAVEASKMLNSPNVQAMLSEQLARIQSRIEFSIDDVIEELRRIGFSNIANFTRVNDGEAYVDLSAATPEQMATVQEITSDVYMEGRGDDAREVKRTKLKLHPKLPALTTLLQYLQDPKRPVNSGLGEGASVTYNFNQVQINGAQVEAEYFSSIKNITSLVDAKVGS